MSELNESAAKRTMEAIKRYFSEGDKLARHLGIELVELAESYAKTRMVVREFHLNSLDMVHGAATFALADFAFAAACNACGTVAIAINTSMTFMKASSLGDVLTAEAHEVSANPKLSSYAIEVRDAGGDLVATFNGLAYRKKLEIKVPVLE